MSSRFDNWDGDGEVPDGLWFQRVRSSLRGKRGQAILAELEEALLALPQKRLTTGALAETEPLPDRWWTKRPLSPAEPTGDVCFVGALALHRKVKSGMSVADALKDLARFGDDIYETANAGENLGMSWSMAWHLGWVNDEQFKRATPEERYERCLEWVRHQRVMPGDGVVS